MYHAWVFFQKGFFDEAEKLCNQIFDHNKKNIEVIYLLGLIYLKDGKIKKAIECLEKSYKSYSNNFELITNLGFAYHESGNLNLAYSFYQEALSINPSYINAYYNLHALQIDRGEPEMALESLKKIITLNPNDFDSYFMLSLLLDYLKKEDRFLFCFEKIKNKSVLIDARIEAWSYLKKQSNDKLILTGSNIETFKLALSLATLDGLILELGVRHGNSINQLAELTDQNIYGFDSFEGLLESWHDESKGSYSTKGLMPNVNKNVSLQKGWFDQTLPIFLDEHLKEPIKLLNVDCDTYQSTQTALNLLSPRIQPGTIIIFDEYIGNQYWKEDEFKAFQEATNRYKWTYEYLAFSFFTKQVVVKII